jgi:hypothetical protein
MRLVGFEFRLVAVDIHCLPALFLYTIKMRRKRTLF